MKTIQTTNHEEDFFAEHTQALKQQSLSAKAKPGSSTVRVVKALLTNTKIARKTYMEVDTLSLPQK